MWKIPACAQKQVGRMFYGKGVSKLFHVEQWRGLFHVEHSRNGKFPVREFAPRSDTISGPNPGAEFQRRERSFDDSVCAIIVSERLVLSLRIGSDELGAGEEHL
jgi:hypothetical protein